MKKTTCLIIILLVLAAIFLIFKFQEWWTIPDGPVQWLQGLTNLAITVAIVLIALVIFWFCDILAKLLEKKR